MDNEIKNTSSDVSSDNRLLAMLCHLSFFLGGIILPVIIWAVQKDKSKFVRFHSLQAIFFQITIAAIVILAVIFLLIVLLLAGLGTDCAFTSHGFGDGDKLPAFVIVIMIIVYGGMFLFGIAAMAYSIYLAVKTYQGNLIKIPVIGNIIYKRVFEGS